MTPNQDQPWSRRAFRENDEASAAPRPEDGDASATGDSAPAGDGSAARSGSLSPSGTPEPLSYITQARFAAPDGDAPAFRPRRSAERLDDGSLPPTQQLPAQETPGYRLRDYSPQGRSATPSWAPSYGQTAGLYPGTGGGDGSSLDFHTQARPDAVPPRPAEPQAHSASHAANPGDGDRTGSLSPAAASEPATTTGTFGMMPGSERTMTRRELRALREAQEAAERGEAPPAPRFPVTAPVPPAAAEPPVAAVPPVLEAPPAAEPAVSEEPPAAEEPAAEEPAAEEPAVPEPAAVEEPPAAEPAPITSSWQTVKPPIPAWAPTFRAPEPLVVEPEPEPAADAEPEPVDEAPAPAEPVALIEPPEPTRWNPAEDTATPPPGSPAVFDALFTPPSRAPEPAAPSPIDDLLRAAPEPEPQAVTEPEPASEPAADDTGAPSLHDLFDLQAPEPGEATTIDATVEGAPAPGSLASTPPSAEERVELPAPPGWSRPEPEPAAASVSGPSAEEPEDELVVEEADAVEQPAAEVHPIVIPATPLPAEPLVLDNVAPIDPDPSPAEAPTGHWTVQAAHDDESSPFATSRDVGGGHGVITTNALVLPSLPQPELSGPLTTTGEILITGSIDLPRSLASTGAHPTQLDQSALDHELDPGDHQVVSTESAPVRAIRAVSTHTSTRGMITNTKPKGNRNLTVLIVAAGVMAALAGTLLLLGFINGVFS